MRRAETLRRLGTPFAVSGALLLMASGAVAQTSPRPADPPKAPAEQPPVRERKSPLAPGAESQTSRSVMGTVKTMANDGLVIEEQKADGAPGKEWAFVMDASTPTRSAKAGDAKAGDPIKATDLKVGDRVVVAYEDRSGKIVAQSITKLDTGQR